MSLTAIYRVRNWNPAGYPVYVINILCPIEYNAVIAETPFCTYPMHRALSASAMLRKID